MFNFTKYSKVYYLISGALIIASIGCLAVFGLKFGIEFTGGSNMEVNFTAQRPNNEEISKSLSQFNLGEIVLQPVGSNALILKFKGVDEATHQSILANINALSPAQEKSFQYIGPSVGQELKNKTIIAIILALASITLYITLVFRKVSRPVSSWKYGITSLVALFHDILIPLGLFALLGHFYNVEVTIPIIAALLTILGFSVHDTIVIFDRIRENIVKKSSASFNETVNASLNETVGRSVSTVLTTLFVMISIFFFGGESLKYFSLALIVGIVSGVYSSIFIAGPLLVSWHNYSEKRNAR
mgnify:CR=1 FL=1